MCMDVPHQPSARPGGRSIARAEATSELLCTAIIGSAIIPLLVGHLSDATDYGTAVVLSALCYAALCVFAFAAARTPPRQASVGARVH
ncbi:hypothetical protein Sala_1026 [Sphingopyxis alaskensis RB2256]|uniref:Uncharacterized protein n=2 Tax=Sphingopyxis alaskensis TaxID=117207 RepID=Q1GUC9_SPHAL|nr:hypothetical protein Sala_1026 [Sphingopyxis alaskensis RB2256]